jgi:hypothetical protein
MEVVCPVCGEVWLKEEEGEFTSGDCEHLKFTLHSECGDDFEISGEWDSDGFNEMVDAAREKDEDDDADIFEILGEIQHPDIDKAMLYIWWNDPLYHPWVLWGYKLD